MKKKLETKSTGPLRDEDAPWNGITLNRCLVVAAIAALLSMGFQVLQDAVDSDDDITEIEAEALTPFYQNEQLAEPWFFESWFGSSKAELPAAGEPESLYIEKPKPQAELATPSVEQPVSTIEKKAKPEPRFFEGWFGFGKSELPAVEELETYDIKEPKPLKIEEQEVLPAEEPKALAVEPDASTAQEPGTIAVEEPEAPAAEEPEAPTAEEPEAPPAEEPEAPPAEEPEAPTAEETEAPAAEEPEAPPAEEPEAHVAEKPEPPEVKNISIEKKAKIKEEQADLLIQIPLEFNKVKDKRKSTEQWGLKAKGKYMLIKAAKIRRAPKNGSDNTDVFPFFKKHKELSKSYQGVKEKSYNEKGYQRKNIKRKFNQPQKQAFGKSFKKDVREQNKYYKRNNGRGEIKHNKKYHQEKDHKKNHDSRYH